MNRSFINLLQSTKILEVLFVVLLFLGTFNLVEAATLSLSPSTNVYSSGATFSVRVTVNSSGQSVNAAEGTLKFNPNELSVVSANRNGSIFNLWVTEPTFSNSAGTISFSGGLPTGYTGSAGTIMNVTFKAKGSGPVKVNFSSGSVLANDGRGTNVLSGMNGGTYTIQAASEEPEAEEVIVEYVAPANTPSAPEITSDTHPDPNKWYNNTEVNLNWSLPSGVTGVRTLLDENSSSIPNKVYEAPIDNLSLSLDEGVQYLHVQFRNSEGWGRVAHYRLAVDKTVPSKIDLSLPEDADITSPTQKINVVVEDDGSAVNRFMVRVDSADPIEILRSDANEPIALPELEPGYHTIIVEAFDEAGNSIVGTISFTILAFERPQFTEYPSQINEEVIPVIKGVTRPNSEVEVTVNRSGSEPVIYMTQSNEAGEFIFIPESRFQSGVYELTAKAIDQHGAHSEPSEAIRIAVQQPGYIQVGSFIVSVLSVIIPLLALLGLLGFATWYMLFYIRRFRTKVRVESFEALEILRREFKTLQSELTGHKIAMESSRKTKKLTKAESDMLQAMQEAIVQAEKRVEKEVEDVAKLSKTLAE
jgi:hypothetical protein